MFLQNRLLESRKPSSPAAFRCRKELRLIISATPWNWQSDIYTDFTRWLASCEKWERWESKQGFNVSFSSWHSNFCHFSCEQPTQWMPSGRDSSETACPYAHIPNTLNIMSPPSYVGWFFIPPRFVHNPAFIERDGRRFIDNYEMEHKQNRMNVNPESSWRLTFTGSIHTVQLAQQWTIRRFWLKRGRWLLCNLVEMMH